MIYVLMLLCISCAGSGSEAGDGNPVQIKVRTVTISKSSDMRRRSYVGQAKAARSVVLTAPYPGNLRTLDASIGEYVSKGDVLAEICSEAVVSADQMAQATLYQAEDGYVRATQVYDKGGITEAKYKEIETELAKARAAASAAQDVLNSGRMISPFDGVVSGIYVHQGIEVSYGAPLIRIIDPESVEIDFSVPEGELSEIREGLAAQVDIPALDREGLPAVVIVKGVEASPVTHTYECTLKLSEPLDALAPGMVCKVALGKDMIPDHIVPTETIQIDRDGRYVWIVEDGVVRKAYVAIGGFAGDGVIVTDGLDDGDKVISEGFRKVSSGMKVTTE